MTPKDHIEDIKNRYLNSDREFVLPSLNRSIDRIEKAFPRYGSFLMEFIQNADDAHSTSMVIEVNENAVRVFNNGRPFSKQDVNSICRVGLSSKTPKDYIGYLGVGFKSVFLISDSPEIYSGDYRFKFSKTYFPDPERTPWQVIPLWIERPSIVLPQGYTTAFNIPIKDFKHLKRLQEETKPEYMNNRVLLFLRYLTSIEIKNVLLKTKRTVKKLLYSQAEDYEIYLIQEHFNEELKSQEYWLVFRSICDVPAYVKEDPTTKEWERENVDKREVIVAFRLDEEENLIKEEKGTAHMGVFSFLPLKEVPSGLNFLIQADFLTTPGRSELSRECAWNNWIAKEIYKLIIGKCIPVFKKNDRWKMNFVDILYSPYGGHELFENNIKRPLREYLETHPCLVAVDGSVVKPDEAVIASFGTEEFISEGDLKTLYPDKKPLHPDCKIPSGIEWKIKKGPSYNSSGIDNEMQRLIGLKAEQRDITFFKKFYYKLSRYSPSTLRNSDLKHQRILPTDTWELADAGNAYIKPSVLSIPIEVKENFKIIHPELSADTTILQFLQTLGVEELTAELVKNILRRKEIPHIAKNWSTFSDNEKVEKIKLCKALWKDHQIDIKDLSFLTLKTKSGKWLKPEEIIFSKEYRPEHQIEILTEKGLFDGRVEFVSAEFVDGKEDKEVREWYKFFKELGVDKEMDNKKERIVQRIGILTALQFEKIEGRTPRELGESEKLGYDIESRGESEERYIEVKSSSRSEPDIFITTNELKTLKDKQKKYFVYVVKDALRNPTLCVTCGDKLLEVTDTNIIIPFKLWINAREEEFHPLEHGRGERI